jgi:dipeptidyl aminopeptidase/acylaminoacyl peptidase
MKRAAGLFVLGCMLVFGVGLAAERSPLTVDDDMKRVRVSAPSLSPDGKRAVFVRTVLNWEKNKRENRIYVTPAGEGEAVPFTKGPGDRAPQWSPDGRFIAFLRATPPSDEESEDGKGGDGKKTQLWAIRTEGGEAFQLTKLSEGAGRFVWAPGSDRIVFIAEDPKSKEEKKRIEKGEDVIFVYEGPNGQGKDSWSNIWVVGLSDPKPRQVTHEKMRVSSLDVSPDGKHVAFIYRTENGRNDEHLAEVAMAGLDKGKLVRLTDNQAPESSVQWTPGGGEVSYLAPDDSSWELRQPKIFVLDVKSRKHRRVEAGFDGAIQDYAWSPDGNSIFLAAAVKTNQMIFRLDVAGGKVTPLIDRPGAVSGAFFTDDGRRAAFVWSDMLNPPDVYRADLRDGAEMERLTDLNPGLRDRALARFEVISWKSKDGADIEGILLLPPGKKRAKRLPLVLQIHGGPAGSFANSWDSEAHIFAGLGYALLEPNVRGSDAYGDEFLRGNMNDLGGGDYEDLMTGVDRLIEDGIADPDRLGVRGWSYGGILGGWVITQTDRFKAASLGAMVSDWTSEYGQGFNFDVRLWYIGGDPWDNPDAYRKMSSLTHAQNVTAATLLLHGEEDTTCTVEQSQNFFNALRENGTTSRFMRFPREEHGFREPRHLRILLAEEISWMQKHLRGIEWKVTPMETEEKAEASELPGQPAGARRGAQ